MCIKSFPMCSRTVLHFGMGLSFGIHQYLPQIKKPFKKGVQGGKFSSCSCVFLVTFNDRYHVHLTLESLITSERKSIPAI